MVVRTRHFVWLFALSLLGASWLVVAQARALPARVATHFDLAGRPDGWMAREQELAAFLAVATVGAPLAVAGFAYAARFHGPETLYVPNAPHWRSLENHPRACTILYRGGLALGAAMAWWSAAVHARLAAANQVVPPRFDGIGGHLAVLAALVAAWALVLWLRFRKVF